MIGLKPRGAAYVVAFVGAVATMMGLTGCHTNAKIADNYPDAPKEKPAFKATYTIVDHKDGTGGCKAIPTSENPNPPEEPCSGAVLGNTSPDDKANAAKAGAILYGINGTKLMPNDYNGQPVSRGGASRGAPNGP